MRRFWTIVLFGVAVPAVAAGALIAARLDARPILLRNVTPSMPLGLYRRADRPVAVGKVVAVRQPALARPYLAGLGFPADALLLKRVVAGGGDRVCASGRWVREGNTVLVRRDRDRLGTLLPQWDGCRRLASDEIFVRGDDIRSFDSRYFGPVARDAVVGVYERLP